MIVGNKAQKLNDCLLIERLFKMQKRLLKHRLSVKLTAGGSPILDNILKELEEEIGAIGICIDIINERSRTMNKDVYVNIEQSKMLRDLLGELLGIDMTRIDNIQVLRQRGEKKDDLYLRLEEE